MKHFSFPSIDQYRVVIKHVRDRANYHGVAVPKLNFNGTVKLHGTNASVVLTHDGVYYAQSRNNVLTPTEDNAGFAAFAHGEDVRSCLAAIASYARDEYFATRDYVEPFNATVVVFGEWCGGSIQSGVALSKLPKMFVIFGIKLINQFGDEDSGIWLSPWDLQRAASGSTDSRIKCIQDFPTWQLTIDFNDPASSQNELVRLTNEVEQRCPVGYALGSDGVGEGIVWTCVGGDAVPFNVGDLIFKVKGEKHSDTKVKTVAPVDIERLNSIKELAASLVTDHRLEKALAFLRETLHVEEVLDVKNIGAFLKWVGQDIAKEDLDTIEGNGFELREVTKEVNNVAKAWFNERLNATVGV